MDTTERMMIMGMCLQGLLANPNYAGNGFTSSDPKVAARGAEVVAREIAANVKLAHRYADALDPPREVTDAERIMTLTRTAYAVLVAADADGAGKWKSWPEAKDSFTEADVDNVDGVFERVSRWYADPTGFPETMQDRIIAAVVAASRD